jgi:hypothetical protein
MKYIKLFEDYVPSKEEKEKEFEYMLLGRLKSDCEYFLGYGCGSSRLWAATVEEHIVKMKELWNLLPVKPEWLSMEQIEKYEKEMLINREEKINRLIN